MTSGYRALVGRRTFLDDERQAELEERGFTIVRILSDEEAEDGLRRIQALEPDDAFTPGPASPAPYHCTFLDPSTAYKQAVDDLTRDLFEERTCALLDRFRMLTSNLYVKPPGTGRFEIHQNWPVTDDIRDTTITLWCPFVEAGPHNGSIQVVPGSHKIVPDTFTVGAPKYFASFYDDLIDHWLEPVRLHRGEAILFDDSLLHWSDVNGSDETRWSAQLVFMPEEKTPVIYHLDQTVDPPRFELYEIGPEFFIEKGVDQLVNRPEGLRLVGTAPAEHLAIDEDTFRVLMEEGPRTRELVYAGASVEEAFAEPIRRAAALRAGAADPDPAPEAVEATTATPAAVPEPAAATPAPAADVVPTATRRRRWWPFGA
jgi:hypothetical protein